MIRGNRNSQAMARYYGDLEDRYERLCHAAAALVEDAQSRPGAYLYCRGEVAALEAALNADTAPPERDGAECERVTR